MNSKRIGAALIVAAFLVASLIQIPEAFSEESNESEKTLAFLRDVIMLDTARYNLTLVFVRDAVGSISERDVKYTLVSEESRLDVVSIFRNSKIVSCRFYLYEGSPLLLQPATNVLVDAKSFLQRYQNHTKASYLSDMRSMLDSVNELVPLTTIADGLKFVISTSSDYSADIKWMPIVNGIDIWQNAVIVSFRNGFFESLNDNWDRYQVGSTEISVSKEEAIRIAKQAAQDSTFVVGSSAIATPNFTFVDKYSDATFDLIPRENNMLFPRWDVRLALDKVYLGSVTGFQVLIWADTGEVAYVTSTGMLGVPTEENATTAPSPSGEPSPSISPSPQSPSPEPSSTTSPPIQTASPSPTPSPTQLTTSPSTQPIENTGSSEPILIAAVAAAAVASIAVVALFLRKRRK